jgi:hypothetical protein
LWNHECCPFDYARRRTRRKEEVAEHKAMFLDSRRELEAATKYMCQFDTENNITVM